MNTIKTKLLVDRYKIKTLKADKTGDAPEVDALLVELGRPGKAIPYYAIYPGDGGEPIHFGDKVLTVGFITDALKKAGPSQIKEATATVMKE